MAELVGIISLSLTGLGLLVSFSAGAVLLARKLKQKYNIRSPLKKKPEETHITVDDILHVVEEVKIGLDATKETVEEMIKTKTTNQTLLYPSAVPIVKNI